MERVGGVKAQLQAGALLAVIQQHRQQGQQGEVEAQGGTGAIHPPAPEGHYHQLGRAAAAAEPKPPKKSQTLPGIVRRRLEEQHGNREDQRGGQELWKGYIVMNQAIQHHHGGKAEGEGIEHVQLRPQQLHPEQGQAQGAAEEKQGQTDKAAVHPGQQGVGHQSAKGHGDAENAVFGQTKAEDRLGQGEAAAVIKEQGIGDLGQGGKKHQPGEIAPPAGGLVKAVDQQEAVDREGNAADGTHEVINVIGHQVIGSEKEAHMVNNHGGQGQNFKGKNAHGSSSL